VATAYNLEFEKPLIELERQIAHLKEPRAGRATRRPARDCPLENKLAALRREIYDGLTPMQRVQVRRHPRRPYTLDYLDSIFQDFIEPERRPSLPRRPGHRGRLGPARRANPWW